MILYGLVVNYSTEIAVGFDYGQYVDTQMPCQR